MKKRLLSLLLALVLSTAALLPLSALATEPAEPPVYPAFTAEDYDTLYVSDGLVLAVDFYKTNPYWNTEGTDYTVPTGPSEMTAYEYGGTTYDLTQAANQSKWRIVVTTGTAVTYFEESAVSESNPIGKVSTPVTEYSTEIEARTAIMRLPALPAGSTYTLERTGSNAMFAAQSSWVRAERSWMAQFTRTVDADIYVYSYRPTLGIGAMKYGDNSTMQYSAFRAGSGFIRMRDDYHASGGLQIANILNTGKQGEDSFRDYSSDSLSLQVITAFNNSLNATNVVPFLYLGARPTFTFSTTNATMTFTGFASNSDFKVAEGATVPTEGVTVPIGGVLDYTLTLSGGATNTAPIFSIRLHDREIASLPGTYKGLSESLYFGWSQTAKHAGVYAIRQYNTALSATDLRRNHLADLCKFFRLDIAPLFADGEITVSENDLATVAVLMSEYTLKDDRETVVAGFETALDAIALEGEGDDFSIFAAAVNAGLVDAARVRALPAEYHAEVYAAFRSFREASPTADAAACQAATDAAVDAVLAREYSDYFGRTPALTAEDFFDGAEPLSDAARHFADVAARFSMDMTPLVPVHPIVREHVYESFADLHPDILSLTPILAARLDSTIEALSEEHYGEVLLADLVAFHGYQLRLFGESGVRALFTVDTETVADLEAHGYTVTLGVVHRTVGSYLEVEKTADGWAPVTPPTGTAGELQLAYTTGGSENSLITVDGETCIAYEKYTSASLLSLYFSAFAIIEREGSETLIRYTAATSDTLGDGPSIRKLAEYCRAEMSITAPAIQILCRQSLTSIYVDGENLTDRRLLAGGATTETEAALFAAVEALTGTSLITVDAAEDAPRGVIRMVAGDAVGLALEGEDIVFTYTADPEADMAALTAAVEAATVKYPVGTKEVNVSLFAGGALPLPPAAE